MQIKFSVDQRQALKLGINAPAPIVALELDPAALSIPERDLLAAALEQQGQELHASRCVYSDNISLGRIVLVDPTVDGLRAVLATLQAEIVAAKQQVKRERQEQDDRIRQSLTETAKCTEVVYMRDDGSVCEWGGPVRAEVSVELPRWISTTPHDPALLALVEQHNARHNQLKAAAKEGLLPELRAKLAQHKAEKAAIAAEYDALYAQLPEGLRARHAGGFATEEEVKREIRKLLRKQAGFRGHTGHEQRESCDQLTDTEFASYQRCLPLLPEGSEHSVVRLYDTDECEDDGESQINQRVVVEVEWTRGGVEVKAQLLLREIDAAEADKPQAMPIEEFIAARVG